ncbi:hypothetical protein DFH09DRAFT_1099910 [Mycena vulgaris]|nr:hypothetical protein DFH09DRAFT_1099910 [Mycena vulgaris]
MKLQNFHHRLLHTEIEAQLLQIAEILNNRHVRTYKLHKERQRRLNNEKKAVQKAIHRITYPILNIPVEITSEIFLHCLPDEPQLPSASAAPMLLAAICREWKIIAHLDLRLWSALKLKINGRSGRPPLIQDWLLRAAGQLTIGQPPVTA